MPPRVELTPVEEDGAAITAALNAVRGSIGEVDDIVLRDSHTGEIFGCELSAESLRQLTAQLKELTAETGRDSWVPLIKGWKWTGALTTAPNHTEESEEP